MPLSTPHGSSCLLSSILTSSKLSKLIQEMRFFIWASRPRDGFIEVLSAKKEIEIESGPDRYMAFYSHLEFSVSSSSS